MITIVMLVAAANVFSQSGAKDSVFRANKTIEKQTKYDIKPYIQTIRKTPSATDINQPIAPLQIQKILKNTDWIALDNVGRLPRTELDGRWFRIDFAPTHSIDLWLDIEHIQYPILKAWLVEGNRVSVAPLLQGLNEDKGFIQIKYPAVNLELAANSVTSVLFFVNGRTEKFSEGLSLWNKKDRVVTLSKTNRLRWAFYGALLAMAAYNLLFSVIAKDRAYAFYAFWMLSMIGLFAIQSSYILPTSFDDGSFNLRRWTLMTFFAVMYFSFAQFSSDFLRLKNNYKRLHKGLFYSSMSVFLLVIFAGFSPPSPLFEVLAVIFLIYLAGLFISVWGISLYVWSDGERIARSFFLSLTPFLLFLLWVVITRVLGSDFSSPIESQFHWASIFLVIMLSVAFADRENLFREKERNAQASNQAKSDFLAKMSHEIRTPLNAVLGMSVLMQDTRLSRQQKTYNETIHRSASALLSVINDILDYSKIEAGKMLVDNKPYDLLDLLREIGVLFQYQASQKKINFFIDCNVDIPLWVCGDKERLRQVLVNLTGNAFKFTEAGEITLSVEKHNKTLHFFVRDTGIGISKQDQQLLFNYFQQADISTSRRYGGTGLGLVICSELCELMGGEIKLSSIIDEGTTIEVILPLIEESLASGKIIRDHLPQPNKTFIIVEGSTYLSNLSKLLIESHRRVKILSLDNVILLLKESDLKGNVFLFDGSVISDDKIKELDAIIEKDNKKTSVIYWFDALLGDYSEIKQRWSEHVNILDYSPLLLDGLCAIYQEMGVPCHLKANAVTALPKAQSSIKLNILIAEDNVVNQSVIKGLLTKLGHQVSVVDNGALVVEAYMAYQYAGHSLSKVDLILMDCEMPEVDGYEATEKIRHWEREKGYPAVPIIALTAHVMPEYLQRCIDSGMNDYLLKPIDLEVLRLTLEKYSNKNTAVKGKE